MQHREERDSIQKRIGKNRIFQKDNFIEIQISSAEMRLKYQLSFALIRTKRDIKFNEIIKKRAKKP